MLISYIPVTKLESMGNKAGCHCGLANLFHSCIWALFEPIVLHSKTGLPMMSGDRIWCQCHPILANFISNYLEQVLVTCTFSGWCPKCEVPCNQLGDYNTFSSCNHRKACETYALADGNVCLLKRSYYSAAMIGLKLTRVS